MGLCIALQTESGEQIGLVATRRTSSRGCWVLQTQMQSHACIDRSLWRHSLQSSPDGPFPFGVEDSLRQSEHS